MNSWLGENLQELLADKTLVQDVVDEFDWLPENDNYSFVKYAPEALLSRSDVIPLSEEVRNIVKLVWKIPTSSNVLMFG